MQPKQQGGKRYMWYQSSSIKLAANGEIRADVHVPSTSPWFDGHFPGEPVLPGVAQLGMVHDVVNAVLDGKFKIVSVRRIRFKRIVRPEDPLTVIVTPSQREAWTYTFRILIGDEQVSSGVVQLVKS